MMAETTCKRNESQDDIKRESSSSPESITNTLGFTNLVSPQSKSSPNQDEQELIDITTVKAEDIVDTHTEVETKVNYTKVIVDCSGDNNRDDKEELSTGSSIDSGKMESSQPLETQSVLEKNMTDNQEATHINSTTNFEEIQNQLKKTLDDIEQRHMVSGFRTLSNATNAVVEHCEQLGLTTDDHPYNAIDREQFWAGLNNCWLYALAQRQEPSCSDEKVTDQQLCSLRERVVAWADKLERYGLVDYEMGWWEADILAAMDAILATNYASAQAVAQAAVAKAAVALFGDETKK